MTTTDPLSPLISHIRARGWFVTTHKHPHISSFTYITVSLPARRHCAIFPTPTGDFRLYSPWIIDAPWLHPQDPILRTTSFSVGDVLTTIEAILDDIFLSSTPS